MKEKYGRRLRKERQAAGVTMGTMARHLGLRSVSELCDVELGRSGPFLDELTVQACRLMRVDAGELLSLAQKERGQ